MQWTVVARGQGGMITRCQLVAAGIGADRVDGMAARGHLDRTSTSAVYRVAGAPETTASRCWFAVLATRSPLSYLTAAHWWSMPVLDDGRVHITRLARRRLDWPPGVRVHRVALEPAALTLRDGMPLTSRTETALDCMGWLPLHEARTFTDRAVSQGWIVEADIARRLTDQPGRWGNRQLKLLIAQSSDRAAAESERMLHRILRRAGVRGWLANLTVTVGGRRFVLDVGFAESLLAIEVDGYAHHSSVEAFQRDRRRQNLLVAHGWTVLRFTVHDLKHRAYWVISTIRTVLAPRRRIGG